MAIFRAGAVVAAISGTVGGQVFVQSAKGNVIRSTPNQVNQRTPRQLLQRASLSRWLVAWRTLTSAQRLSWNAAARVRNFPNRLGVDRQISGFNLYVKLNIVYQNAGLALLTTPTLMETTLMTPIGALTYTNAPPFYFTLSTPAADTTNTRITSAQFRPNAAALPLNNRWVTTAPDYYGPTGIAWIRTNLGGFGYIPAGAQLWIQYQAIAPNKLPSPPQLATITVPA